MKCKGNSPTGDAKYLWQRPVTAVGHVLEPQAGVATALLPVTRAHFLLVNSHIRECKLEAFYCLHRAGSNCISNCTAARALSSRTQDGTVAFQLHLLKDVFLVYSAKTWAAFHPVETKEIICIQETYKE